MLTCSVSVGVAHQINGRYVSALYAVLLGLSATAGDLSHQPTGAFEMSLAVLLVSTVFVLAESLRLRRSWLRGVGYGMWVGIAAASLLWFKPPAI